MFRLRDGLGLRYECGLWQLLWLMLLAGSGSESAVGSDEKSVGGVADGRLSSGAGVGLAFLINRSDGIWRLTSNQHPLHIFSDAPSRTLHARRPLVEACVVKYAERAVGIVCEACWIEKNPLCDPRGSNPLAIAEAGGQHCHI